MDIDFDTRYDYAPGVGKSCTILSLPVPGATRALDIAVHGSGFTTLARDAWPPTPPAVLTAALAIALNTGDKQ